mgnify:CR=1 FL=1
MLENYIERTVIIMCIRSLQLSLFYGNYTYVFLKFQDKDSKMMIEGLKRGKY